MNQPGYRNAFQKRSLKMLLAMIVVAGVISCQKTVPQNQGGSNQQTASERQKQWPQRKTTILVDRGDELEAIAYYGKMAKELEFPNNEPPRDIDALLGYCGYGGLKAKDIERLRSEVLMDFDRLKTSVSNPEEFKKAFSKPIKSGDLLSSRFFAPKITDVSGLDPAKEFGWRKVVRLRTRKGSQAAQKGVAAMFLLFNFFEKNLNASPFEAAEGQPDKHSPNNQVMLIRNNPNTAYWLVFGALDEKEKGERINFLQASFDAAYPDQPVPGGQIKKYFLPVACAQCHGESKPQLNYLDSDHWFDRVQPGDDFSDISVKSQFGVIFDGGKDTASSQFKKAFEVLRQLNQEIRDQNKIMDTCSFQLRAVENWLKRHEGNNTQFFPPIDRPIPPINPQGRIWTKGNATDEALLPLLNQYCYRCHSSALYHVFDKEAVLVRKDEMHRYIETTFMPQDRLMDKTPKGKEDKQKMLDLLKALK